MPAANIKINGVVASNFDVTIASVMQLDNVNVGGETTYLWEIADQPDGTADTLSNAAIQNPTITVNKEGTYLFRLTVNAGGGVNEKVDLKEARVLHLKTRLPEPAAGETTQAGVDGWKDEQVALNRSLRGLLNHAADPTYAGVINVVSGIGTGQLAEIGSQVTIKSGLPGQEVVPGLRRPDATDLKHTDTGIGVVDGPVKTGGATSNGSMVRVRRLGMSPTGISIPGGVTVSVGHPVFVSDAGLAALSPGTNPRRIGRVIAVDVGNALAYWAIDQGQQGDKIVVGGGQMNDFGANGWARAGGCDWATTVAAATRLVAPFGGLKVGALITAASVRLKQATNAAQVSIGLYSCDASGAETLIAGALSAASSVEQTVSVTLAHDATKAFDAVEVLTGVSYYMRYDASGDNGNNRIVGSAQFTALPPGCKPG